MRIPGKRVIIQSWTQTIDQVRTVQTCDQCGFQICGCYVRFVVRYQCENIRYGSSLMVERKCDDCC